MKKHALLLKSLIVFFLAILASSNVSAQFNNFGEVIKAGKEDANILLEEYATPLGKAWGADLSGGWYNTASAHSMLGFDLTFSTSFAKTPDADLLFDLAELELNKISSATSSTEFPTLTNGDDVNSITITEEVYNPNTGQNEEITILPETEIKGFNVPVGIPMPSLNLGFGLVKNTEIVARYVPTTGMADFGQIGLWGVGVKHDVLQWLPIVDKLPILKASIFLGYTKMNGSFDLTYQPEETVDNDNGYVNPENQQLQMETSSFHSALLVGAKLPVVHPYLSFGLSSSNFGMDLAGEYALPAPELDENDVPTGETELRPDDNEVVLQDPLSIDIANGLKPSVAAGLRIKMAVLTFHAQYTLQEYPMITGGIGISFR
ncbi:MAG: DUF6588 family protein [Bacteroidales bacterium]